MTNEREKEVASMISYNHEMFDKWISVYSLIFSMIVVLEIGALPPPITFKYSLSSLICLITCEIVHLFSFLIGYKSYNFYLRGNKKRSNIYRALVMGFHFLSLALFISGMFLLVLGLS